MSAELSVSSRPSLEPYDALMLVSFGGPEAPDEVMPFLRRVTAGRNIPDARLETVAEHYFERGGRSPINDECRALLTALRSRLDAEGLDVPLAWGNRNGPPELVDVLRALRDAGARRVLAIFTSAYSSYSSCRQYRENLADALTALALEDDAAESGTAESGTAMSTTELEARTGLTIDRISAFATGDAFTGPMGRLTSDAVARLRERVDGNLHLLFVTHSIPDAMNAASGPPDVSGAYVDQHRRVAQTVAARVTQETGIEVPWTLTYCSRSGPPAQPWLEPDINDAITDLAARGVAGVVISPIGFVADHMEVIHDLDDEAVTTARSAGMDVERASTVRDDPEFVAGLVRLAVEQAQGRRDSAGTGRCAVGCCASPRPRPALCGGDEDDVVLAPAVPAGGLRS